MPKRATSNRACASEAELLESARRGDASGLGGLFERHRPGLFAEALGILGYRRHDEIEDLVQEAFLRALANIAHLRQPEAFHGWLRTILRNACLQHLRRSRLLFMPIDDVPDEALGAVEAGAPPGDGVWAALELLPEALRATVLLRHFSAARAYDEIASMLGVPVGTVRSRLHQARMKLAAAMRAAADEDSGELLRRRETEAALLRQQLLAFYRCEDRAFFGHLAEDLVVRFWKEGDRTGRHLLERDLQSDVDAGVGIEIDEAFSSGSVSLVEARLLNPPHDPHHCPPAGAMLMFHRGALVRRVHLHLSAGTG